MAQLWTKTKKQPMAKTKFKMAAKNNNNRQREVGEEPFAAVDAQSRPKQARWFVYNQSEDFCGF